MRLLTLLLSQAIPKFWTFVVRVRELQKLRAIVLQNTVTDSADERRLLHKYTLRAAATTAVIGSSFVLAYALVIVGTYAFSVLTGRWLNPLKVQIPGVRYDGRSDVQHFLQVYCQFCPPSDTPTQRFDSSGLRFAYAVHALRHRLSHHHTTGQRFVFLLLHAVRCFSFRRVQTVVRPSGWWLRCCDQWR